MSTALTGGSFLKLMASTGVAGVTLQNGTPTFISWSVPNDGQLHVAQIFAAVNVTSAETGGKVDTVYTGLDGISHTPQLISPNLSVSYVPAANIQAVCIPVKAGTVVSIFQETQLTAGAATLFAQIWGF